MNIAIYLRVSDADHDLSEIKNESDSIENQRILILNYISQNPELMGEIKEYADDGFTGTNFNRPAFQAMINDAKNGMIDTIVTKDLSRLGREYIGMGDYLEQIFPLLGVRVIAINSGYDSRGHEGDVAGIDSAITNLINTMYSRDLSVKRKTTNRTRWSNGTVKATLLPYGYEKNLSTGEWMINEYSGNIVRRIFEWAASGMTTRQIADKLNEEKIVPPGLYNKNKHGYKNSFAVQPTENIWAGYKVRAIIQREEYLGYMIAHKKETDMFQIGKEHRVPKSEWIYISDHHPAIISKELFDAAQVAYKKVVAHKNHNNIEYSLKYKLKCGTCKLHLAYRPAKGDDKCYCRHRKEIGIYAACNDKLYNYRMIEGNVYQSLIDNLEKLRELGEVMDNVMKKEMPENKSLIETLNQELETLKDKKFRQYEDFTNGRISLQNYMTLKDEITKKLEELTAKIDKLTKQTNDDRRLSMEVTVQRKLADEVIGDIGSDKTYIKGTLSRQMADMFINMVYVYDTDRLEIEYSFDDLMDRAMERFDTFIR